MTLRETVSLLTFPGVIIHELGHKLFCDFMNVKVKEVKYFRLGDPAGYVIHDAPRNFKQSFFITVGPFIFGTLLSIIFFIYSKFYAGNLLAEILFFWLGISSAARCFPSYSDAKVLWKETNRHIKRNFFAIIGYPFVLLIWIVNWLDVIWIEFLYALFLYVIVNHYIFHAFL